MLLALQGYAQSYERVRDLARTAREKNQSIVKLAQQDPEVGPWLKKIKPEHLSILEDPGKYTGQSRERTLAVCARSEREITSLRKYLQQEKNVLSSVKAHRLTGLHNLINQIECGEFSPPVDFCPAEERKEFILKWIKDKD